MKDPIEYNYGSGAARLQCIDDELARMERDLEDRESTPEDGRRFLDLASEFELVLNHLMALDLLQRRREVRTQVQEGFGPPRLRDSADLVQALAIVAVGA